MKSRELELRLPCAARNIFCPLKELQGGYQVQDLPARLGALPGFTFAVLQLGRHDILTPAAPELAGPARGVAFDADTSRLDAVPDAPVYGTKLRCAPKLITAANERGVGQRRLDERSQLVTDPLRFGRVILTVRRMR
ncbi:hypothetical protein ACFU99_08310 [Streptomyces sp. NPDC057654]|uniref:hypothetical protein n=1 Tax=Streptomyces sp. NPDC057654 TaxID=3346196 RepID=UPI0036C9A42D